MRWATAAEVRDWDTLIAGNPGGGHVFQSRAWGEVKRLDGWRPAHIICEVEAATRATLFLRRRFFPLGDLWYAPKGPAVVDAAQLRGLLHHHQLFHSAFAIRVEPELSPEAMASLNPADGIVKSPLDVQPYLSTVGIDLTSSEADVIARFKPKTRYNIRLARRKGVEVQAVPPTRQAFQQLYALLATTHRRAGFPGFEYRSPAYFFRCWDQLTADGHGQLFFASVNGDVVAGAFIAHLGKRAWYKDGGSEKLHTSAMAPYLLQWEVMRWLHARGVHFYDMVGVPPQDKLHEDHPLFGLWRFKSGFSDEIIECAGTYDLPLRRGSYSAWTAIGERMAHALSHRVRGELLY